MSKTSKPTLKEIADIVFNAGGTCANLICKKPLSTVHRYDHDGGVEVEGYTEKQWVFFECIDHKCTYGTSLNKALRKIKDNQAKAEYEYVGPPKDEPE